MRAQILQAVTLVAALYAAGPLVSPATVPANELPHHVGQRIEVLGHVVEVDPTPGAWRVTVEASTGSVLVLDRETPPPLGAKIRVVGDASMDRQGPVVWAEAWTVEERPDRSPVGVEALLEEAPRWRDASIAAVGTWNDRARALEEADRGLPVEMRAARPPDGERIVAWGVLVYVPGEAGFRLKAVGWEAWTRLPA